MTDTLTNSYYYIKSLELHPDDMNVTKTELITQEQFEQFISNNNGQVQSTSVSNDITTHSIVFHTFEEIK